MVQTYFLPFALFFLLTILSVKSLSLGDDLVDIRFSTLNQLRQPAEKLKRDFSSADKKFEKCVADYQKNVTIIINNINVLTSNICFNGINAGRDTAAEAATCLKNAIDSALKQENEVGEDMQKKVTEYGLKFIGYGVKILTCGLNIDCYRTVINEAASDEEYDAEEASAIIGSLWAIKLKMIGEIKVCTDKANEGIQSARKLCNLDGSEVSDLSNK